MEIVIGLVIGLAVGAAIALVVHRQASALRAESGGLRAQVDEAKGLIQQHALELREAQTQLEDRGRQVQTLTTERDEARRDSESLSAVEATRASLSDQLRTVTGERDQARSQLEAANVALGEKAARLAEVEADHAARQEELDAYRAELEDRFKGIATNVTQSTREDFIKEFRDLTRQQSELSQEAVTNLVKPVRERLSELQKYVDESDKRRATDYAQVSGGVERLLEETSGLRRILHNPGKRGEWGEQHLRNVMQAAGMTDHVDYIEQEQYATESGAAQPDVVVHIPGGMQVVIDAKTPFDSYDRAMQSENDEERRLLFGEHARALLGHAQTLKSRDYARWVSGSPDFVMMYLPTDPMLDTAIDAHSSVWQEAWERHRVLIATPGLLIAFLRTVALAWQQQDIQENAQQIARAGVELYERLATFTGHLARVGGGLDTAVRAFNQSVGSYEGRVLPSARRFESLGAVPESKALPETATIEREVRELRSPESQSQDNLE